MRASVIAGDFVTVLNQSGGADRRFAQNRRLPICLRESIRLTSRNGLNELVQVSRSGFAEAFSSSLRALVAATGAHRDALPALPAA